jgi:Protein of unknown function (DUF3035)
MEYRSRAWVRFAVLGTSMALLMGCQSIRNAAGMGKEGPDEFAVVTKQPLVIPPEYNLRPPRDGAPPTNQVQPTDSAQSALFDSDPAAAAKMIQGDYSQAEKLLLAQANAANPDPSIRQEVASDGRAMEPADDTFTQQMLFWQDKPVAGNNVDAEGEDKRLQAQKAAGKNAAPPRDTAKIQDQDDDDNAKPADDDKSSWWPF